MLPSRGLVRTSPASMLRSRLAPVHSASPRHFSALARASIVTTARLGTTATTTSIRLQPSALPSSLTAAQLPAAVFASRHGATRNLSLWGWGWGSGSKTPTDPATTTTEATTADTQPVVTESMLQETKAAPVEPVQPVIPEPPIGSELVDPAAMTDHISFLDLPEHIGYLKEIGLDYGLGPTAMNEWLLEHIYIYTGLPWYGAIALTALAFRVALFWPTVVSTRHSALLQKAHKSPEYVRAYQDMQAAMHQSKDNVAMMQARQEMKDVTMRSGAKFRYIAIPFITVPFSYGMFRLMRGMAAIPVPSLENGGILWFTDLTIADPYYILPLANAVLGVAMFKATQKNNVNQTPMAASMGSMMTYVLPPLVFMTTAWLPAAVQWFFLVLTGSTTVQSLITMNPAFRKFANLPGLEQKPVPVSTTGAANAVWQAPNATGGGGGGGSAGAKPSFADKMRSNMSDMQTNINQAIGNDEKTMAYKKASEYEQRRAEEERIQMERRLDDMRRKRAGKKNGGKR